MKKILNDNKKAIQISIDTLRRHISYDQEKGRGFILQPVPQWEGGVLTSLHIRPEMIPAFIPEIPLPLFPCGQKEG